MDYLHGHTSRAKTEGWIEEDRGYETRCWIWTGAVSTGSGRAHRDGKYIPAYRALYEDRFGPIPFKHHLHHLCRVQMCVNPDHMNVVTPSEHRVVHTGISDQTVLAITEAEGSQREIARRFGVSQGTVWRLKHDRRFRDRP